MTHPGCAAIVAPKPCSLSVHAVLLAGYCDSRQSRQSSSKDKHTHKPGAQIYCYSIKAVVRSCTRLKGVVVGMGDYAGYVNAFATALSGCNGRDPLSSGETQFLHETPLCCHTHRLTILHLLQAETLQRCCSSATGKYGMPLSRYSTSTVVILMTGAAFQTITSQAHIPAVVVETQSTDKVDACQ